LSKIIQLYNNARPITAELRKATLATMGWEIKKHRPYCPDLDPSNFYLFGQIKLHLRGQKYQNNDELKRGVLNWLRSQDKTF
jgi:hypothetical protein